MPSLRRLDMEKLRTRRILATAALTVVTFALLLLCDACAPDPGNPRSRQMSASGMPRSVRPQEE
jgi:hypothetical protein